MKIQLGGVQFGEYWEVIPWSAESSSERRCERRIRRGYHQVKNVTFVVSWEVNMLRQIERGQNRQKRRGEVVSGIVEMQVKVAGKEKFVRRGGSRGKERGEFVKKTGKGFRK